MLANACCRGLQEFAQQPADQRAGGDWAADRADFAVSHNQVIVNGCTPVRADLIARDHYNVSADL